jgi:hypothetical protein
MEHHGAMERGSRAGGRLRTSTVAASHRIHSSLNSLHVTFSQTKPRSTLNAGLGIERLIGELVQLSCVEVKCLLNIDCSEICLLTIMDRLRLNKKIKLRVIGSCGGQ